MTPVTVQVDSRYRQEYSPDLPQLGIRAEPLPMWNLDGICWHDAPPPPRSHQHWAQTVGYLSMFQEVWRCPCGAIGGPVDRWVVLDERRVSVPDPTRGWLARVLDRLFGRTT